MEQIQLGKGDVMFFGAGEAEDWGFSVMFDAMGALSTKRNDTPEKASCAFDQTRDGYDMVAPSGEGGQRCMKLAMDMANKLGGIKKVFTEAGYQPNVGSTKSLSGHALGAAGVHEAIYCLLMMQNDFLAESANI